MSLCVTVYLSLYYKDRYTETQRQTDKQADKQAGRQADNKHRKSMKAGKVPRIHERKQQRRELPTVTLTWHASKCLCKVHKLHNKHKTDRQFPVFV